MVKRTPLIIKKVKCDGVELNPTNSPTLVYYNHFITKVYSPLPSSGIIPYHVQYPTNRFTKPPRSYPAHFTCPVLGLI